jgi:Lar family restriction alleviation protein
MKLKPCPFCGGVADTYDIYPTKEIYEKELYGVVCTKCGASTENVKTEKHAVRLWNGRKEERKRGYVQPTENKLKQSVEE